LRGGGAEKLKRVPSKAGVQKRHSDWGMKGKGVLKSEEQTDEGPSREEKINNYGK